MAYGFVGSHSDRYLPYGRMNRGPIALGMSLISGIFGMTPLFPLGTSTVSVCSTSQHSRAKRLKQ